MPNISNLISLLEKPFESERMIFDFFRDIALNASIKAVASPPNLSLEMSPI